ncbi:hypothetical protein BDQ12DRAFT_723938 [Crucibulum laeve]|uniref:Uncharacterized protein n=1 Tax=Crucibulum laeve TaxID=68775 RepID=A0A5C3LZ78_9AGAR|nr:hypothetical protein BDQ12DRAFT_723938 [Crucibulum laeve]
MAYNPKSLYTDMARHIYKKKQTSPCNACTLVEEVVVLGVAFNMTVKDTLLSVYETAGKLEQPFQLPPVDVSTLPTDTTSPQSNAKTDFENGGCVLRSTCTNFLQHHTDAEPCSRSDSEGALLTPASLSTQLAGLSDTMSSLSSLENSSESNVEDEEPLPPLLDEDSSDEEFIVPTKTCTLISALINDDVKEVTKFFPSWFNLSDDEDSLGPIPDDWELLVLNIPILPELNKVNLELYSELLTSFLFPLDSNASEMDDYYAVDSDDEAECLQLAIENSLSSHKEANSNRRVSSSVKVLSMAVIVKVVSDEEAPPIASTSGQNRQPRTKDGSKHPETEWKSKEKTSPKLDKGKMVDPNERGPGYSEFTNLFETKRKHKQPTPKEYKLDNTPMDFKRDSSEIPSRGWFQATTVRPDTLNKGSPLSLSDSSLSNESSSDSESMTSLSSSSSLSNSSDYNQKKSKKSKTCWANSSTSGPILSTTTNYQVPPTQVISNIPHYHPYAITTTYQDCQHISKHDHTPHPSQGYYTQP